MISMMVELPPRARRIQRNLDHSSYLCGTTSACAENTLLLRQPTRRQWNYLRVRGEYSIASTWRGSSAELPPRARRIHRRPPTACCETGTTSACAENTWRRRLALGFNRNYLRVRGEYCSFGFPLRNLSGTTSACAENTPSPPTATPTMWNYLRVRGEYRSRRIARPSWTELPPRARRIHTIVVV